MLAFRSSKLHRARQLNIAYPRLQKRHIMSVDSLNVLFICSRNQWRSPTAENIFSRKPLLKVRSAGTSSKARHTVTSNDIRWADVIMVMESKHRQRLQAEYPGEMKFKECIVLNIEDDYHYMDPELINILNDTVASELPDYF